MAHQIRKETISREPAPSDDSRASLRLSGLRILVVEDGSDNRELFTFLLKLEGASVATAVDGRQGIEMVRDTHPDLVLMDIQMPGMDGYEATAELRRQGFQGPVIALTAHAYPEERERSRRAGCNDHVTKPIDTEGLIGVIRHHTHHTH